KIIIKLHHFYHNLEIEFLSYNANDYQVLTSLSIIRKMKNKLLVIIGSLVSVGTIDIISKIMPGMSSVRSVGYPLLLFINKI
ncbi:MAG: hypothetical protein ITD33_06890, partial [Nitrosarchaeum sp.]|nr:hypothetical protein [Nitrosarchaeum sp.]